MNELELGTLADEDEGETLLELWRLSFGGPLAHWRLYLEAMASSVRVARRGGRLAGGLAVYRMGQWWGGRPVPLAGIAAVGVAPAERGRGVARTLMRTSLRELREEGFPLAALYASTQRVYRAVGFEQAGARYGRSLPIAGIDLRERDLPVHPIEAGAHEHLHALYRARAVESAGQLARTPRIWERVVRTLEDPISVYLAGELTAPEGYVVFAQSCSDFGYDLRVRDLVARTPRAARRLWTLLGDHHTLGRTVSWFGPAVDPVLALLAEQQTKLTRPELWMLRILDLPAALGARGYPAGVAGELSLEVRDALFPENAGRFLLRVDGGRGEVERGGSGALRLDVRALAPLYSGLYAPGELRSLGWLSGEAEALELAARIFAGPQPWLADHF